MTALIWLALLGSALFAALAPRFTTPLPPAGATWLLTIGGLITSAATIGVLGLLALPLVGQTPLIAHQGRWSGAALRAANPVATPVAAVALAVLLALLPRVVRSVVQLAAAVRCAARSAQGLPGPHGELAVLDDADRYAYALPGVLRRSGRIVVSSGLLRALNAQERRALLEHERSHLRHRHHLHVAVGRLIAAVNPMLCRLPAAVDLSVERWADEDAAATCPRERVADALVLAATGAAHRPPVAALGVAAGVVAHRVAALRAPAERPGPWRSVAMVALLAGILAALVFAAHDTERLFEFAQQAYANR